MSCRCCSCVGALFPRERGQCHGFGRYAVPCRRRAPRGGTHCYLHAPPIVIKQSNGTRVELSRLRLR